MLRDPTRSPQAKNRTKKRDAPRKQSVPQCCFLVFLPLKDEVGTNDRGLDGVAILGKGGVHVALGLEAVIGGRPRKARHLFAVVERARAISVQSEDPVFINAFRLASKRNPRRLPGADKLLSERSTLEAAPAFLKCPLHLVT